MAKVQGPKSMTAALSPTQPRGDEIMKTGMTLMNAGCSTKEMLSIISTAVNESRDMTVEETHRLVKLATAVHCHALELERVALGIPAPKRG